MATIIDKKDNMIFVKFTQTEFSKLEKTGLINDDESNFDSAVKSKEVKSKLSFLASKL